MNIELVNCTNHLLREIGMPGMKRNDIALSYALAMRSSDPTDWAKVNRAIIDRWSKSALVYIKERAHRIAEGKVQL